VDSWGIETQYIVPYFPVQRKGFPVPFCRISMTFRQKITLYEEIHNLRATAESPLNKGFFTVSTDFSTAVMLTPFSPNCCPFLLPFPCFSKRTPPLQRHKKEPHRGSFFNLCRSSHGAPHKRRYSHESKSKPDYSDSVPHNRQRHGAYSAFLRQYG